MPCATARRVVALVCAGQTIEPKLSSKEVGGGVGRGNGGGGGGGRGEGGGGGGGGGWAGVWGGGGVDRLDGGGHLNLGSGGRGGGGIAESDGHWWDMVRGRLMRGVGFTECLAEDVLLRLEWAAAQEADDNSYPNSSALSSKTTATTAEAAAGGEGAVTSRPSLDAAGARRTNPGTDDLPAAAVVVELRERNEDEVEDEAEALVHGGGRRGRMLNHLAATRVLCVDWGLLPVAGNGCAAGGRGGGGGGGRRRRRGRGDGSGDGRGGGSGPGSDDEVGGGSWSGWEAFALAVLTSSSQDRLPLCFWAVRPLMGQDHADCSSGSSSSGSGSSGGTCMRNGHRGIGGRRRGPRCPGLPRGEVIELLCLMLCALRSFTGGSNTNNSGGGGGSELHGQARGSLRLTADLLVCARVLENWDVR